MLIEERYIDNIFIFVYFWGLQMKPTHVMGKVLRSLARRDIYGTHVCYICTLIERNIYR